MTRGKIGLTAAGTLLLAILAAPGPSRIAAAAAAPCEIDRVERIVAVGDVHGAYDRFVEILQTAGLLDGRLRWSGGTAHLVQVGDVVDRGPDSLKTFDLLQKLEEEAPRAGGAVHALLGNHEVMRMLGDLRYTVPGEYQAFVNARSGQVRDDFIKRVSPQDRDDVLKATPLGLVEMRVAFGRQGNYGKWLRKLNVVVKINGILFAHGGVSPTTASLSCSDINRTAQRELTEDETKTRADPLHTLIASEGGPLWYRGLAQESDAFEGQVDEILAKQHLRAIVIGHTIVPEGRIRVRFGGKVVQIDTGMQPEYVERGRASALDIQNDVLTAVYTDRRDILATLTRPADTRSLAPAGR
jgi:calcineurin-like phosphoesterase family protein